MRHLGYTEKWIQYGIIEKETIEYQLDALRKGEDQNPEYYRYQALVNWLKPKEFLTDEEAERFIELTKEDSDQAMAGTAVKVLLTFDSLADNQFDYLCAEFSNFREWTEKVIGRERIKRQVLSQNMTYELFEKCLAHCQQFNEKFII
ncbi:hypothetical protein V6R21_13085 [Limibacter armeniacum]|uniref:hypothetical protein n=1 Tax=Limibacter armeniacum TaxID=466084 RepID=UPI002FE6B3C6